MSGFETTEIRVDERGDETHESWLLIRANHVGFGGGVRLFDSEIDHQRVITVTITRCSRQRQLNHDYLHGSEQLLEIAMSQAQWGAFVSSFGNGTGVPATLWRLGREDVPQVAEQDSRLAESTREVRDAANESLGAIREALEAFEIAFADGGKRLQRDALRTLHHAVGNAPANMEFAAKSLNDHVENVVTKARADIEGMVLAASSQGELPPSISGSLARNSASPGHVAGVQSVAPQAGHAFGPGSIGR